MKSHYLKVTIATFSTCILAALIFKCASRDGEPYSQSNPFDPGGNNFLNNQKPQYITTSKDSTKWYDFNLNIMKGIIKFTYNAYDPNEKYDTITYTIYTGDSPGSFDSVYSGRKTALFLSDISPAQTVYFKITAKDRYDSSITDSGSFTAPSGTPPRPPNVTFYNASSYYIQLKIDTVSNTAGYRIYRSESVDGDYIRLKDTVPSLYYTYFYYQNYVSDYKSHYYVVSTYNVHGESRSYPPEEARICYSGISAPYISSVSQGYYYDSIQITWYGSSLSSVKYYLLYRKESTAGKYHTTAKIANPGTGAMISCMDTVYTGEDCYYRLAAFDSEDRGSEFSSAYSGYFARLSYPYSVSASYGSYSSHIYVSWSSVSGAISYNIYRSISSAGPYSKITTTAPLFYNDSVKTTDNYYYKISANDSKGREGQQSGYVYGYIKRLSAPSGLTASDGTYSYYILISWYGVSGAAKYYISRSTSSSGTYTIIDSTTATSYKDSTITGTAYYYYKAAGVDSTGKMGPYSGYDYGYLRGFSYPSNFLVSRYMYKNRIALTWDKEPLATSYKIYKSTSTSSSSFVLIASVTGLDYNDTSVAAGTLYYYKISAVNNTTESSLSPYQFGYLLTYPQGFAAIGNSGYIYLQWTTNSYLSGYAIYRSANDTVFQKIATINNYTTYYFCDTVFTFNVFYYKIAGLSTLDESSLSPSSSAQMIPQPPDSLRAEEHPNCVTLKWKPSEGAKTYYVYRGTSSSTYFLDSITGTSYNDSLYVATRYYYQVASKNGGGVSIKSNYIQAGAITAPLVPGSFSVTSNPVCIALGWYQNTGGSAASLFYIYRSTSSGGTYTKIDSTSQLAYYDSVKDAATYYYMVSGRNLVGEGPKTSYIWGRRTVPSAPNGVVAGDQLFITHIPITWEHSLGADGYYIYRSTSSGGAFTKTGETTDTFYNDSTALVNIQYYYSIAAYNIVGQGVLSAYAIGKILSPPSPPGAVYATQGTKNDTITVSWNASNKTDEYAVYRDKNINFSNPTLRGKTTKTSFDDTTRSDTLYVYRVKAINQAGESVLSTSYAFGCIKPTAVPGLPRDFTADSLSTHIGLSWNAPYTGSPITAYTIYRSDAPGGPFQPVDTTSALTYNDYVPLTWPTYYWYQVTAKNSVGEGQVSNTVKGTRK